MWPSLDIDLNHIMMMRFKMVLSESPNKKDTVRISWEAATKTVIEKVVKLRLESDYGKN